MRTANILRLGARDSALARWQAEWVASQLQQLGCAVELVPVLTQGDRRREPIAQLGGIGVFTKELQQALLDDRVDIAVHSLKDLPTVIVPGLCLSAVPRREDVRDAWISRNGTPWSDVPARARIGTGSLRRRAQLLHQRSDLQIDEIRGNVDTRLRKLDEGQFDGIILAAAGLTRLGWQDRITEFLPIDQMLPAVGQGALGIETRSDDERARRAVERLDDPQTHAAVLAERSLLATLRGGCLAPVGAWARSADPTGSHLRLDAVVLSADGRQRLHVGREGPAADPARLGVAVADELLRRGAESLLDAARTENS